MPGKEIKNFHLLNMLEALDRVKHYRQCIRKIILLGKNTEMYSVLTHLNR
jgi:hypothetical protein